MITTEIIKFIQDIYEFHNRKINKAILDIWSGALQPFDSSKIMTALHDCVATLKYCPTPPDVIERIPDNLGHPGIELAFHLLPWSDKQSGWLTQEIMLAGGGIDMGNPVMARMAFRESYGKILMRCRQLSQKPRWYHCGASEDYSRYEDKLQQRIADSLAVTHMVPGHMLAQEINNACAELGHDSGAYAARVPALNQLLIEDQSND